MKTIIVAILVLAGMVRAGTAIKPSTRPIIIDTQPLYAKVEAARAAAERGSAKAIEAWETSGTYKDMKADVDAKRAALEAARTGDDARAKLDASAAYNAVRLKLEKMTKDAMSVDPALTLAVARAESELHEVEALNRKRQEEADAKDPIKQAMKNHTVAIGMTVAQVETSVKVKAVLVRETETQKLYDFSPFIPASGKRTGYLVWFVDGKAADIIPP